MEGWDRTHEDQRADEDRAAGLEPMTLHESHDRMQREADSLARSLGLECWPGAVFAPSECAVLAGALEMLLNVESALDGPRFSPDDRRVGYDLLARCREGASR